MTRKTKIALVAGTAVLALAGVGGGVAFAAGDSPTPAPTPAPAQHHKAHNALNRVEHGRLTLRTKHGDRVLDVQRGRVTAVSPTSVTVRSADGFTSAYGIGKTTELRSHGKTTTIADVHTGDRVRVRATSTNGHDTITGLADTGS
jgi:hypothetical protein